MIKLKLIALLLLLLASYTSHGEILEKRISLSFSNIEIKEVLAKIESKTNIRFTYQANNQLEEKVSGIYQNETLKVIFKDIFYKNGIDYQIVGNNVALFKSKAATKKKGIAVSGYVYDKSSGEVLIGCKVYENSSKTGTITNNFGYFSLTLEEGEHALSFSYVGYKKQIVKVSKSVLLNIKMEELYTDLKTVVVTSEKRTEKVQSADMGKIKLSAREINAIPAVGGEVDVLKAITLLPGVKQGVDGSSGFYVRGGGPDQNLILLDGVPLYNPYHLWGFLSTFNAEAINNIEITKGAFPARYGGRLSSVLDITMNEGNNQKWSSSVTMGLLSAKASVSGPVVKDKSSIMLSARRTYLDLIIVPFLKWQRKGEPGTLKEGYNFTDLNLKYNHRFSDKDRLYFSGFFSRDKYLFDFSNEDIVSDAKVTNRIERSQGWGNAIATVRWNHLFGQRLFVNTTAYFSSYNFFTSNEEETSSTNPDIRPEEKNSVSYTSDIIDYAIKQDYQFYINRKHTLRFGGGAIFHDFSPGVNAFKSETGTATISNAIENNDIQATELSLYIEDEFELSKRLRLNAGVHASSFLVQNTTYYSVQPRLSGRFLVNEKLSLKGGYSSMTQYLHLLTSSGITQSSDLWVPSTDLIKPQRSHQVSIGSAYLLSEKYVLEVEGYYKTMTDLIDYKDGATFLTTAAGWESRVAVGDGESYGAEVFLKKNRGKLTGWLGYTISWTNRQFEEINFGQVYPYRYDRRHDVSLVGNYKLSDKWSLNGSWVFYTGNAVTLSTAAYAAPDYSGQIQNDLSFISPNEIYGGANVSATGIVENPTGRNNYRLPNYHRLDITAVRNVKRAKSEHTLTVGITNIYNRLNPSFFVAEQAQDVDTKEWKIVYKTRTLFPIMPSLSYSIKF